MDEIYVSKQSYYHESDLFQFRNGKAVKCRRKQTRIILKILLLTQPLHVLDFFHDRDEFMLVLVYKLK